MLTGAKRNMRNRHRNKAAGSFAERSTHPAPNSSRPQANTTAVAHAKQSYERFMALGRAAAMTGDAVETENFYQHAEHYLRLLKEQGT
jgi:hypothetical protein